MSIVKKVTDKILQSVVVKKITHVLDNTKISGFDVSLFLVLRLFYTSLTKDDINTKANSMAFSFLMAVFPGIIFLFTLIPYFQVYFHLPDLTVEVLTYFKRVLPDSIYLSAEDTISDILGKERGGLLSFGFILSTYAALNGTTSMIEAFNKCYHTKEKRGFLKMKFDSLIITFFLVFILLASIIILIIGELVLTYLINQGLLSDQFIDIIEIVKYSTIILSFYFSISFIYYYAPAVKRKFAFFSWGSTICTFLIIVVSMAFTYYLNNFATYNKVYGSIGTLIGLMLWYYLISLVLLIGFEFNAAIDSATTIEERERLKLEKNV